MLKHGFTGEVLPPPFFTPLFFARNLRALCVAAILILVFLCTPRYSTAQPTSPPQKNTTTRTAKAKPKAPKNTPHADTWAFSTQTQRPVDQIWTRGMAPQAMKQAAVVGLKNKALKNELKAPSVPSVTPPMPNKAATSPLNDEKQRAAGLPLGKNMRLRGDMESLNSSWHNSSFKNDMRIDQDITRQETNVYGAYADIEASDDLTLSAGPEFSHTRTQNSTQHNTTDSGSLGLGLQLKWGF